MHEPLVALGGRIKELRKSRQLTLQVLAEKIGMTAGLLSKVENARTVPSLPVLMALADAFEVNLSDIFEGIACFSEKPRWLLVRASEQHPVEREESSGINYALILETTLVAASFQVMLVTVQPGAEREMVTSEGYEMLYLISGDLDYCLGEDTVTMDAGDTLYFDGNIPHVPVNRYTQPAVLLVCYFIREEASNSISEKK